MLRQRILSALVLAPVAVAATWVGSWMFAAFVAIGAALAAWEWVRLVSWSPLWTALGAAAIGVPAAALIWMRAQDRETALWVLLVVWATDSFAYLCGRAIGGPKLAPQVSPNKTWAGLVGGILGAAATGWAVAVALLPDSRPVAVAGLSVLVALAAQGGDLLESALKRRFHVKDTGQLIPGHGGLLDRIDGLMAAAPAAAAICLIGGGGLAEWR